MIGLGTVAVKSQACPSIVIAELVEEPRKNLGPSEDYPIKPPV
jgi:hypothetical protein